MAKKGNSNLLNLLMVFAKNPVKGAVKSRLAKTIGPEQALEVYKDLVHRTIEAANPLPCDKAVFYSNHIDENDEWSEAGFQQFVQSGDELGARMANAFDEKLMQYQKVVIIGSDCPDISTTILQQAFETLNHKDIVLGPAEDGGYYLLGMKQLIPELFQNKPWSTHHVLKATLQDLKNLDLKYDLLPELNDIDNYEDLKQSGFYKGTLS